MLQLKEIRKDYVTSSETVHALRGVSLSFRKREFVSILGPSGCGKTTLLNIIGGLDKYTDGDLVINGTSTKEFRDRDWDAYRNYSIGFVFQSYNLIPHQTVLGNVELALTLSGVSKTERRERAKAALEEVGLGDQLYKRPSEMSGGQMQRVAIARALVNNPDIILADEPTGALDTKTSVQVMEILKKISKERLIIMVTHNPEIAEEYSSRIIRMVDGNIVSDSDPYSDEECEEEGARVRALAEAETLGKKKKRKPSMSFFTSFMLSLRNLFTKKGRTMLTAFAGSIGIIGIALILAVSQGMTAYINSVQETTLSSYPLTLESTTIDISELMQSFMGSGDDNDGNRHENDAVYKDQIIAELVNALSKIEANENDLGAFKLYLEQEIKREGSELNKALSGVQYAYQLDLDVYTEVKVFDGDESKGEVDKYEVIKSDTGEIMAEMLADFMIKLATNAGSGAQGGMGSIDTSLMGSMMRVVTWEELLPGMIDKDGNRALVSDTLKKQYDVVYGSWPTAKNEIVLVLNENNELDDLTLYALGLLPKAEIDAIVDAAASGKPLPESSNNRWTYEEICNLNFKTIFPYEKYEMVGDVAVDKTLSALDLALLYKDENIGMKLKVVGIIRPNAEADSTMLQGSIGYTYALTEYIIESAKNSPIVQAQLNDPNYDIFSKLPFKENTGTMTREEKKAAFMTYVENLPDEEKANVYVMIKCLDAEKAGLSAAVDGMLNGINSFEDLEPMMPMIEQMLAAENSTIDITQIGNYFKNMSADAIKELLRPYVEDFVRTKIHEEVTEAYKAMPANLKVQMLKAELAAEPGAEPISGYTLDQFELYYDNITKFAPNTYKNNLIVLGCLDLGDPFKINLFASSFENKDIIVDEIAKYNAAVPEEQKIAYTDLLGIIMSSITTIINAITYVLIAFVSISLIVSSIMIGVITLISVQERTKEIGILRAIGASKKNVSSMFNAETMIIGLAAGLLGVTVTYLLCIPINIILHAVTGISNLSAVLPPVAAIILVAISVLLTLVSGIIPSRSAAKKDPVVALRTE